MAQGASENIRSLWPVTRFLHLNIAKGKKTKERENERCNNRMRSKCTTIDDATSLVTGAKKVIFHSSKLIMYNFPEPMIM